MIFYEPNDNLSRLSKENLWREMRLQKWIRNHCKEKRRAIEYRAEKDLAARREKIPYPNKMKAKSAWQRGAISTTEYASCMQRILAYWRQVQLYEDIKDYLDTVIRNQDAIIWYLTDLYEDKEVKPPRLEPHKLSAPVEPGPVFKFENFKWHNVVRDNEEVKEKRNDDSVQGPEQTADVES